MRVLLVWPNFAPDNAAGVRGRAFARGLAREGVEVVVAAPPDRGAAEGAERWRMETLPLERDRIAGFPAGRAALRDLAAREAPDLILASSPAALVLLQAHAARTRAPFVSDVRDLAAESLAASYGRKLRYALLQRVEGRVYRGSSAVLAVSTLMREALVRRYGVAPERARVVPNGADLAAFAPHRGVGKAVDVVFAGGVEGRRIGEILRAYAAILAKRPETRFRFLGWGGRAVVGADADLARLGLEGAVERIPRLPHTEVPRALCEARLGVVAVEPSEVYRMAVGAKVYEYLAAGLPVVALGAPGDSELRRLLEGERCGLLASDMDGFVAAVLRLLDDGALRAGMAAAATAAAARFDRDRIVREAWRGTLAPLAEGRS